ncbi:VacJ family lipoprotein [uncultured Sphingomonas sp.]|uniref:MlaA family lipoprotein n=1 Tax=uncultured Sphingomonas sp. TaxID=158754 RepID=UPI0035CB344A
MMPALALLLQAQPAVRTTEPAAPVVASPAVPPAVVYPMGNVVPPKRGRHTKGDPFERFNRYWFRRQQVFDRHFLRPVALGYKHVVPNLLRTGLRNFFSNLGEPLIVLNYVLQLKPGKAVETATRFVLNSTIGLGGAVDVAKSPAIRLPHRPNGLGDTLGYYGVKPGPYLFLPLLGPTTLRDLVGGQAEAVILPFVVGTPFDRAEYQVTRAVVTGLDARAEADSDLKAILGDAVDPYATFRSVFLQDRAGEIADLHGPGWTGKGRATGLGDPLADPAAATGTSSRELQSPLVDPAASPPAPQDPSAAPAPGVPPAPSKARELQDPLTDPAAPTPAPAPAPAQAPASTPS